MSKYTTEVRYICESTLGLAESQGFNKVNDILKECHAKIFNFDYPIFDEAYRESLEIKILRHYYTREIGLESVGLWKLLLSDKLNMIMPYYNQLYESALIKIEPLINTKLNTRHSENAEENGKKNGTSNETETKTNTASETETSEDTENSTVTDNRKGNTKSSSNDYVLSSDTPQGGLEGIDSMQYLTNATNNRGSGSVDVVDIGTTDSAKTHNGTKNINKKEDDLTKANKTYSDSDSRTNALNYLTDNVGLSGVSQSKLLTEYRETFLNVDKMVIDELDDLFMNLW